jgi:prephenate dehydratase
MRRRLPAKRPHGTTAPSILQAGIEDNPENLHAIFPGAARSRDSVAGCGAEPGSNKISIAFSVENRPGSLVAALTALQPRAPT